MTIKEYISDKLRAYAPSQAQFVGMSVSYGIDFDSDVEAHEPQVIGKLLCETLEELILAPKMSNISEAGFSTSWDFSSAGKYYLWLCRKWRITPNDSILAMLGTSIIVDRSNCW